MNCEGKLKLRSYNTSYCLTEVVTKAGFTVFSCLHNDLRSPGYSEAYIHLIQTKNNTHYNTCIVSTVKK